MNEIQNYNATENKLEDMKIGQIVLITLNCGGAIFGQITACMEHIAQDGMIVKSYRINIDAQRYIDIYESEISSIHKYDYLDKEQYFEDFKEKYGVNLLEDDGTLREVSIIVNELLVKDIWDKMDDTEKETLMNHLSMDCKTEVDLINALDMSRKRNNEIHKEVLELTEERIKAIQSDIDFQDNYNRIANTIPECKWAFDFFYKLVGVDKLLGGR